ncbi:mucin-2-like [Dorcoceras hygrometricum]|uniref:Mucin-2-like n=1 Tax=Dorcoceras hygrometricum TaxID=472368 RepID=A0A2Z7APJ0_9LAMI|nr:mucin-2-like [Dorcoceras hygrometricum]
MASALISNSHHIFFDSVLAMDDAGLVAVFEALVATGLKDFLGCPAIYYEASLTEFFENSSVRDGMVVSTIRGMIVEISENVFAEAFQIPMDGLTDFYEVPKDLVFDMRSIVSDSGEQTPVTIEVTGETVVEQESAVENVIEEQRRDTVVEEQPSVEVSVESVDVQRAETAVDISEEETVSAFEKSEPTMASVPVAESATEEVIPTSADDMDVIIEQVIAETAQMGADEEDIDIGGATVSGSAVGSQAVEKADEFELWLNLSYEEFHARQAEQPVVTTSDTDEDINTIDVGTGVRDQQLQTFDMADSRTDASVDYTVTEPVEKMEMAAVEQSDDEAMSLEEILMTIPVNCPLPSVEGEVTKIQLGQSISIPGVDEGDWYKVSLPKIPTTDKGKAPLQIRDPIKGNPVKEQLLLIVADINLLVQLREKIIYEVDKFFNSFSLKKLDALQTDDISAKEELVLSWAEAESTRVALNRKTYIITKYKELLILKFLEAHRANFVPGEGSSAVDLKILDKLSSLHLFLVEELKMEVQAHGLKWDRTCCSQIFEGRPRDRGAAIARTNTNTRSTCWIRTMILVDGVWVVEPCGDHWVKIPKRIVNNEILRQ